MKQLELNFENKSPGSEATKPEPISPTLFQDSLPGKNINKIEKKIATMGDNKSDGAWKAHVARNQRYEAEQKKKFKSIVENSSTPVSKAPQGSPKHKSDIINYINKMNDIYGNGKENVYPSQATPTQVGELAKRLEEGRQMTGEPNTWDLMKMTAHTREEKNELKRILNKQYYKRGPKDMDPEDLKYIGKHKSQITSPKIETPTVSFNPTLVSKPTLPPEPRITVEETIKVLADERLKKEQRAWDRQHGRSGITDLLRPI